MAPVQQMYAFRTYNGVLLIIAICLLCYATVGSINDDSSNTLLVSTIILMMVTSLIMVMYFLSTNLFDDYIRSLWRLNNNDPSNGQLNDADNEDQSILVLSDTERRRALKSLLKSEIMISETEAADSNDYIANDSLCNK